MTTTDLILTSLLASQKALQLACEATPADDIATRARYRGIALDLAKEISRRVRAVAGIGVAS